jgi:hypothetical protein
MDAGTDCEVKEASSSAAGDLTGSSITTVASAAATTVQSALTMRRTEDLPLSKGPGSQALFHAIGRAGQAMQRPVCIRPGL